MELIDDKDKNSLTTITNHPEFEEYLKSSPSGLKFMSETLNENPGLVIKSDYGDFYKWLRKQHSQLKIDINKYDRIQILRSNDFWLPLTFLANDITLPFYINLVSNYVYDKMKGAIKGDKGRVHLKVVYKDKKEGILKEFSFDGDVEALQKVIMKFDPNSFFNK